MKRLSKILLRIGILLLLGGVIALGSYYNKHPNIFRCFFITQSSFDQVIEDVYVSRETPLETRNLLRYIIDQAKVRNEQFWGSWKNHPTIIYCHTEADMKRYGSSTPGVAYLNPFQCFIVISKAGLKTDVMAHEMCHVELFKRIGWIASEQEKPAWFDEGLALMLDYRYAKREEKTRYFGFLVDWDRRLRTGSTYLELSELRSKEKFARGDLKHTVFAYLTAGKEVSRWLEIVGNEGLYRLTKGLRKGKSFDVLYAEIEQQSKLNKLTKSAKDSSSQPATDNKQ